MERVNIRPRKFFFIRLIHFCRSHMIKGKTKERFFYNDNVIKKDIDII
jgi:hypothetical protein